MEFITAIDKILQTTIVRWALLVMFVVLSVSTTVQTVRLKATNLFLSAEKGQNAEYAAKLTTQNDAIKKAADDMATMRKQADAANAMATELGKKLQQRKVEIREVVLHGTCPDMVQQVLDEVRK
jgi:hypothetical protein